MIKIGMLIGSRYEILEKIGTGGMSDVYKAKCHKLNRYVAVKVLKQEFSENENFVSKFRVEAQAAAGLAHPNIVNVYDVGSENGIHYIVMELVEGITLKKYIEKKARLTYKEAVSIAIQIAMGIEAAHNNHIIHRDIKPQNIIISKEGKVKVTDFGIAKAASSNTITSNVMGSVHYTSPEQARGGYSDEKSDIYSLGITMFEMLTGCVPFNGDTTVAIAIKHIQEEMPSPREYVPEVPVCVENIIFKCCQKSPDRRYQNMQEVFVDLKQALLNPENDFVVLHNPDLDGGTRVFSEGEVQSIKRNTNSWEYETGSTAVAEKMRLRSDTHSMNGNNTYDEDEEDGEEYNPQMERLTTFLVILFGVVICGIIIFLFTKLVSGYQGGDSSPIQTETGIGETVVESEEQPIAFEKMPSVVGKSLYDASEALRELGMIVEVTYEESEIVAKDVVLRTSIPVDTPIKRETVVNLTVSAGVIGVRVPGLVGDSFIDAESKLTEKGFVINRTGVYSDDVAEGIVMSQNPKEGTKAAEGSVVTLTVSLGKEVLKTIVPNVMGCLEEDAVIILTENNLLVGSVTYVFSEETPKGQVCYQSYSQGVAVDIKTPIDLKISQGSAQTTYKCNANIEAPTLEEAPDYLAGSPVAAKLVTDDGKVLLELDIASFPYAANFYGLTAKGGTLTMIYQANLPSRTEIDSVTGEEVVIPGGTEERAFTRRIEFTAEE